MALNSHFQPLLVLISLVKNDQISLKKLNKTKQTKKVCDRIRVIKNYNMKNVNNLKILVSWLKLWYNRNKLEER